MVYQSMASGVSSIRSTGVRNRRGRTYRVSTHRPGLLQYSHSRLQEWFEAGADCKCDIAETAEDRRLDAAVEDGALERCEQDLHESLAVGKTGVSQCAADVAYESNSDGAQLVLVVRA